MVQLKPRGLTQITCDQDQEREAETERVEHEEARTPPRGGKEAHHGHEQREEATACEREAGRQGLGSLGILENHS